MTEKVKERTQSLPGRPRPPAGGNEHLDVPSVYKTCVQLLAVQEIPALCEFLLDALLNETGSRAALLWVREGEASETFSLAGTRGNIDIEKFPVKFMLPQHPYESTIAKGMLFYDPTPVGQRAVYIPFHRNGEVLGLAYLVHGGNGFQEKDIGIASTISDFASLAVMNAFRFRRLARGTMKEWSGGPIYTFPYFMEFVSKQVLQARRYQKTFSLLALTIENYHDIAMKFQEPVLKAFVEKIMTTVGKSVRDCDLVARKGENSLILLLPETDYFGSLMASRRIHKVLKGKRYIADRSVHMPVKIVISSASFPRDGEDIDSLLKVLSLRVDEQKNDVLSRLDVKDQDFWSMVSMLLNTDHGVVKGQEGHYSHVVIGPSFIDDIQKEIVHEIARERYRRGILFIGGSEIQPFPLGETQSRIFVLRGPHSESEPQRWVGPDGNWNHPSITQMVAAGSEAASHRFILFLNEDYAYGLVCRSEPRETSVGFHTDDPMLVDRLIAALQDKYFHQTEVRS